MRFIRFVGMIIGFSASFLARHLFRGLLGCPRQVSVEPFVPLRVFVSANPGVGYDALYSRLRRNGVKPVRGVYCGTKAWLWSVDELLKAYRADKK